MPTIDENIEQWGRVHDWPTAGDEWSSGWGGTDYLWWGTVHPRIFNYLPARHCLEIAPGFGRITQFLHPRCDKLTVVDVNQNCVDACRERFRDVGNIDYHVNDGRSLDMVDDDSVDFAFSFDSLVHADADAVEAYVGQLSTKLTPDGVAFVHHSNVGSYMAPIRRTAERLGVPPVAAAVGHRINRNWRAEDVSAASVDAACRRAGLHCVAQEKVNWYSRFPNDCFSVFTRAGSKWDRPARTTLNLRFMEELRRVNRWSQLYGGRPGPNR